MMLLKPVRLIVCMCLILNVCREWTLDSQIRYIKVVSGPVRKESILVGLKNGQIFRIFVNNAFPNFILKQQISIRCLDLSLRLDACYDTCM